MEKVKSREYQMVLSSLLYNARENQMGEVLAYLALLDCFLNLLDLHLAETFDLEQSLAGCSMDRLRPRIISACAGMKYFLKVEKRAYSNGIVAIGLEFSDV